MSTIHIKAIAFSLCQVASANAGGSPFQKNLVASLTRENEQLKTKIRAYGPDAEVALGNLKSH